MRYCPIFIQHDLDGRLGVANPARTMFVIEKNWLTNSSIVDKMQRQKELD